MLMCSWISRASASGDVSDGHVVSQSGAEQGKTGMVTGGAVWC